MTEVEQIVLVRKNAYLISAIENPGEAVQLAAVDRSPWAFEYIWSIPYTSVIKIVAISDYYYAYPEDYNITIRRIFHSNTLLMNKWIRYRETMRNVE